MIPVRGSPGQSALDVDSTVVAARGQGNEKGEITFNEDNISVGGDGQWCPFHTVNHRTLQLK